MICNILQKKTSPPRILEGKRVRLLVQYIIILFYFCITLKAAQSTSISTGSFTSSYGNIRMPISFLLATFHLFSMISSSKPYCSLSQIFHMRLTLLLNVSKKKRVTFFPFKRLFPTSTQLQKSSPKIFRSTFSLHYRKKEKTTVLSQVGLPGTFYVSSLFVLLLKNSIQ